jgi:hypothetical protein
VTVVAAALTVLGGSGSSSHAAPSSPTCVNGWTSPAPGSLLYAAAPFDTLGYESPDWRAFVGEGPFRPVPGLPGLWSGIEHDFVTGEGDSGNPGLPPEVEGRIELSLPPTS